VGFNPSTQRHVTLRRRIKTHIIWYHTRNRMQSPQIKSEDRLLDSSYRSCIYMEAL
jgi:hypothetical protein